MTQLYPLTMLFALFLNSIFAQNLEFSTALIPESLTKNSNSVVRFENYSIDIKSQREMVIKTETAITILNNLADDYSDLTIPFDKRRTIKNIKVYVYDGAGNEIKKIKKNDFKDYSATGSNFVSDSRILHYDYTPTIYPYTIYYSYEINTSNTAFIPDWILNGSYYQSVQNARFSIQYPTSIELVKFERNFKDKTEAYDIEKIDEEGYFSYKVNNIVALEREPNSPLLSSILPNTIFGINKFNLEGIDGEANNWEEFGKWYYQNLIHDRMELPAVVKEEIRKLVLNINDDIEKAKIVYNYVQDKVRYISIQLGIGGFTPMLAADVDKLSYGDCKALTNYTASLLREVGVTSYHALIYGDQNRKLNIVSEVVSQQGNHMVLYIPNSDQDLWLECTMQNTPFADSGDFTDDRDALVITPEGGLIKHTRVYDDKENQQNIIGVYSIADNGGIKGKLEMVSTGTQFDQHLWYENSNAKELDKMYKEFWDNINNMTLEKVKVLNNKKEGKFEESVTFNAESYGVISGERMIFCANAFNVREHAPKRMRTRKLPIEVSHGYFDVDEVEIKLPDGYSVEAISNDVFIDTAYGTYTMTIEKVSEKELKFKRKLLSKTGSYPKEAYNDYRSFWKQVVKSDNSKIVLIKN
jgi:transglutaminase-like putative cysteine protease